MAGSRRELVGGLQSWEELEKFTARSHPSAPLMVPRARPYAPARVCSVVYQSVRLGCPSPVFRIFRFRRILFGTVPFARTRAVALPRRKVPPRPAAVRRRFVSGVERVIQAI